MSRLASGLASAIRTRIPYHYPHPYPYYRPYLPLSVLRVRALVSLSVPVQVRLGPGPYPYGPYYGDISASFRLQVTPRNAEVFVDGHSAGVVDKFDGTFQRLYLAPGSHEIALFLEGYRTVSRTVYANPGSGDSFKFALEPLPAGEKSAPPPPPPPPPVAGEQQQQQLQPPQGARPPAQRDPVPSPQAQVRFGSLSIAVQPSDAEIFIDGERWTTSAEQPRLLVRLAEGQHVVEVKKPGFQTYSELIGISRDRTLTLNVSLSR